MNARALKILAWMLLYGTVGGVIAGTVSGYRRAITATTLVLMPLIVLLEMWYATAGTFTGDDGLFLAAMVVCAALFAIPISRSLIHLYASRFAAS